MITVWIGLIGLLFFLGLPFFWMTTTAFKPVDEVLLYPPRWLPGEWRWQNFIEAWKVAPFARFYVNSLIVSAGASLIQVSFSVTMAYALVYIRFPYRKAILLFVLATMAVPDELKIIPNFLLISRLDWVNTYAGLIIPVAAHAFPVFVMTQWFRMLPRELVEAARVDGAGHVHTLTAVILPSCRSVLVVLGIFSFVNRWNDYLWPLIATNKVSMRTLPIGLAYLRSTQENIGRWDLLMAASLLATLPLLLLFVIFQGQIVGSMRGFLPPRKT